MCNIILTAAHLLKHKKSAYDDADDTADADWYSSALDARGDDVHYKRRNIVPNKISNSSQPMNLLVLNSVEWKASCDLC